MNVHALLLFVTLYCLVNSRERIFLFYECVKEYLTVCFSLKMVVARIYAFEAVCLAIKHRRFTVKRVATSEILFAS